MALWAIKIPISYTLCIHKLAPFKEKNVCQLQLRNTTQGKIGFKMKCTAADYYASNPASGIIEPNNLRTISGMFVCLSICN